jgi:hypothetical protein
MTPFQSSPFKAIPLKTKISFALGAIFVLGLLFFFAFAFFVITVVSGVVLFFINLFQRTQKNLGSSPNTPPGQPKPYHRPPSRDNDDVIDI